MMFGSPEILARVAAGSPLTDVAWQGTRPSIPGIIPDMATVQRELPHVVEALPPDGRESLHEYFEFAKKYLRSTDFPDFHDVALNWFRQGKLSLNPQLDYRTDNYKLAYTPLHNSVVAAQALGFAFVTPTEIMAFPRKEWERLPVQPESVHHFYFHVSGYYYALGFRTSEERDHFVNDFTEHVFPPEQRHYVSGHPSERFFVGGWHNAGKIEIRGELVFLFLMTPHAFRTYQNFSLYELVKFDELPQGRMSDPTREGTVYIHASDGRVIGLITNDGRCFRIKKSVYPAVSYDTASHAAILRRQIDPFGLGVVPDSPTSQLREASDLIKHLLWDLELFKGRYERESLSGEYLAKIASERLPAIRHKLQDVTMPSLIQMAAHNLVQGIDSWKTISHGMHRRHVRFIMIQGQDLERGFIATDGLLLHKQIADLAFPYWAASRLQEGDDTMPHLLRGGVLELEYDEKGKLEHARVVGKQFQIMPAWGNSGACYIAMTPEEVAVLETQLAQNIKSASS